MFSFLNAYEHILLDTIEKILAAIYHLRFACGDILAANEKHTESEREIRE
jgi:hypothetical protein